MYLRQREGFQAGRSGFQDAQGRRDATVIGDEQLAGTGRRKAGDSFAEDRYLVPGPGVQAEARPGRVVAANDDIEVELVPGRPEGTHGIPANPGAGRGLHGQQLRQRPGA
nr:hypothetical protein [Amycolatopsis pithecellobii]